jgi:hypothetical protein
MIGKSIQERYADADLRRVIEQPRDQIEEDYAQAEAMQRAKAIWDRFGKSENHRKRVIMLLAQEVLKGTPPRGMQPVEEGLLYE